MRNLVRTISAVALAACLALVPAAAASAKKPKTAAWAKKYSLKGAWRAKDADRDGLKNLAEFKLHTNPRKADSDKDGLKDGDEVTSANDPRDADTDGDGIKDGAEHAGVVTAFDGDTVTIRQFKGGTLKLHVDDSCDPAADSATDEDPADDDGFADSDESDWSDADSLDPDPAADSATDEPEPQLDLNDNENVSCDVEDLEEDAVLNQARFETRGGANYLVAFERAD